MARKAPGGKRGHGIRGRRRSAVLSALPEAPRMATIRSATLPAQYRVVPAPLPAGWAIMSRQARSLHCRICGNNPSGPRTHSQHKSEVHIGRRCHFPSGPAGVNICGAVYRTEAQLLDHLNNHLLPVTVVTGARVACGWARMADCPSQQRNGSFAEQQNMLRHVRKHQVNKAKACGDVVDHNNDYDPEDDNEEENESDTGVDPPSPPPRGPPKGDGPDPPPPAAAPQQVAAY